MGIHSFSLSSLCEPDGQGELKYAAFFIVALSGPYDYCVPSVLCDDMCHRLNCDYGLGGVMGFVLMCIFSVV